MLAAKADPESRDQSNETALEKALKYNEKPGHTAVVEALLAGGADHEAKDKEGAPALSWAAENDRAAVVGLLLAKGTQREAKDVALLVASSRQ